MADPKRRLMERVLDPSYSEGVGDLPIERLREMRAEARDAEAEVSFERRLCHARIDILTAELDRRAGKGGDLVTRLPEILATEEGARSMPLPARAPDFSIPRNVDVPRRRVEEIVGEQTLTRLSQIQAEELQGIISSLHEHERTLSERRRAIHDVLDGLQGEIVRRYTTGEADPTAALG